jgi:integrase
VIATIHDERLRPREKLADPVPGLGRGESAYRLVKRADLPRITLHQVRHSFATIALEQGVDVLYVSELLGHSSAAITQAVYQHSRPERVRDAVNTISKAIGG